ncbi:MAG: HAMP domain-containing protein [Spirochaetales bacterium]|nr:HAMP domain-containing protein [Spirochaetales bacterium]
MSKKGFFRFTIGKRITLGYLLSALLVFVIGFIGFINLQLILKQTLELKESGEILIEAEKLIMMQFKLKETIYNYINTSDKKYIDDYRAMLMEIKVLYEQLAKNIADSTIKNVIKSSLNYFRIAQQHMEYMIMEDRFIRLDDFITGMTQANTTMEEIMDYSGEHNLAAERTLNKYKNTFEVVYGVLIIFCFFFCIVISLVITKSITKPLLQMVTIMTELTKGNLTRFMNYENSNEIGTLARNFDNSIRSIRELVKTTKSAVNQSAKVKEDLIVNVKQTYSIIAEITAHVDSINKQMVNLNDAILTSSGVLEKIHSHIQSLADQIIDQSNAVEESSASVAEMVASISNVAKISMDKKDVTDMLVETTETGGSRIEMTNEHILKISDNIDVMHQMIEMINNIAEQTDLLSMNASIEAAHAGEQGRGFAVVAEEIRKLSASSADNVKQISSTLNKIVEGIKSTQVASNKSGEAFEQVKKEVKTVADAFIEITHTMNELSSGTNEILKSTMTLSDVSIKVRSGADEMKSGTGEIGNAIEEIDIISTTISSSLIEISRAIKQINQSIEQLSEMSKQIDDAIEDSNKNLNRFQT